MKLSVRCYGTDKVLKNVVKHAFNGMFGVQLNAKAFWGKLSVCRWFKISIKEWKNNNLSSLRSMRNYVTVLTVFAAIEKENGAFKYYKAGHGKKNCFTGELDVNGSKGIHLLLLIVHIWTVMMHNTCVTVLTKEEEILKTVASSWFRKALIWYTESTRRMLIRCFFFFCFLSK